MPFSNDPSKIGAKLGPKLVHLISQTVVATKVRLLDTEHRARVNSMQEIIDRAGHEIADLYKPVWDAELAAQDIPDHIRTHIDAMMSGRHQWQAIAGLALGSSGAPSAISTIISNYLAPGVRFAVAKDPQLTPSPETMAVMGAKGTWPLGNVYDLSHGAGYSDDIITGLVDAARSWPDITTILELLRRNVINLTDAVTYMERNGIPTNAITQILNLAEAIVSPADLADMVVRGIRPEQDAAAVAAQSGITEPDFHDLTLLTGEPPGLEQLLEGYRRGFIDQATLERGIRESRYRDEWIPLLEQLRYSPMSVADAVNAVVQNYLTSEQGDAIAQQNGLAPGQFAILQETAGEPLSRTEMQDLYNRGLVTEDQVNQAERESRLKDKYIPYAFMLHQKVIPIFTLQRAVKAGAVDHATAVAIAMESGYTERDSEIIVAGGAADKLATYKNKVVSSIESAYEDNLIAQDEAANLIEGMGFDQSEAAFILQAAEFRRASKVVTQVSNAVRSKYVSRHIDRNTAGNDLSAVGLPASQRDFLLALWDLELEANTRHLTEAQIVKAVKLQLISPDDGGNRLVAMGYSPDDASLLIQGA